MSSDLQSGSLNGTKSPSPRTAHFSIYHASQPIGTYNAFYVRSCSDGTQHLRDQIDSEFRLLNDSISVSIAEFGFIYGLNAHKGLELADD